MKTGFVSENRRPLILLGLVFIISRILAYLAGVRFDSDTMLADTWQLADAKLLQTNLLQTIFYLNTQPPLFNLFVGLVLKIFPHSYNAFLHVVFVLLGALNGYCLYYGLRKTGARVWLSVFITAAWLISPACILFESWFFYDYPITALLTFSALAMFKYANPKNKVWGHVFFGLLAVIVLSRSMFHPVFFIVVLVFLLIMWPLRRKQTLIAAAVPLILVLAWPVKNALLFGNLSSGSWFGMNLYRIVTIHFPKSLRAELIKKGELNKAIEIYPFARGLNYYKPYIKFKPNPYPQVPLLANSLKEKGMNNFHAWEFRQISAEYQKAAFMMIKKKPLSYLKGIAGALVISFETPSHYMLVTENLSKIAGYDRLFYPMLVNFNGKAHGPYVNMPVLFLAGLTVLVLFLRYSNYRKFRQPEMGSATHVLIGFILFCIAYVTVIGIMAEYGENMRFRFQVIPVGLILTGYAAEHLLIAFEARRKAKRNALAVSA